MFGEICAEVLDRIALKGVCTHTREFGFAGLEPPCLCIHEVEYPHSHMSMP